jgi:cell division protein FtsQ
MPREPVGLNGEQKTVREEPAARAFKPRAATDRVRATPPPDDEYPSIAIDQEDEEQFLRAQRRVPVRRLSFSKKMARQVRRVSIIAIAVAACLCMAGAAYGYARHSWRFRIDSSDNVEIAGVQNAPRDHVLRVASDGIGKNVFYVSLDQLKRQLEQIPWVESASVMRLLPNRIAVRITERTPVAFVQIGSQLGSRISLIDSNGVVMGMPASRQTKYSFPVVRGITETEPLSSRAAAMKIYNRMTRELDSGGDDGARYTRQLSEVDLSDPEDVKVVANEGSGTLLIHLGAQDFLARYKLYLAHVKEWRQQFPNLQSVDLRYEGQIIVNPDAPHELPAKPTVTTETLKHGEKQADSPRQHTMASPAPKQSRSTHAGTKKTVRRGAAESRRKQKKHGSGKSSQEKA